jgi:hypothetical protein
MEHSPAILVNATEKGEALSDLAFPSHAQCTA